MSKSKLRNAASRILFALSLYGVDLRASAVAFSESPRFLRDRYLFSKLRIASRDPDSFPLLGVHPCLQDRRRESGDISGHYFKQDLYVARAIYQRSPRRHVDVGSSLSGFVAHVASFRDIEVIDIRPLSISDERIKFMQADLLHLDESLWGSADSVSCLHALEHIGLGRYGDDLDYQGWQKGLESLESLLEPGGYLYLSVPTGRRQGVVFNAHRVFALPFLRDELTRRFDFEALAFIDDYGILVAGLDPHSHDAEESYGAAYGCSIWTMRKRLP